jgi:hypothetical protein
LSDRSPLCVAINHAGGFDDGVDKSLLREINRVGDGVLYKLDSENSEKLPSRVIECDNRSVRLEFSFLQVAADTVLAFVLADDPPGVSLRRKTQVPGKILVCFRNVDFLSGMMWLSSNDLISLCADAIHFDAIRIPSSKLRASGS